MLPLAETQRAFSRAVLTDEPCGIAFAPGGICLEAALRTHRNTAVGALVNALRLTFPTVEKLVGEAFFDQAACAFVQAHPPGAARLSLYGDGFADFVAGYKPAADLHYLADVARLDRAIDRAMMGPGDDARRQFALDESATLDLPEALAVLNLAYPVDLIRDALDAGDDAALEKIDLRAAPRAILIWRTGRAVSTRLVSVPAAEFLRTLFATGSAQAALTAAQAVCEEPVAAIRRDIFAATFCRVISTIKDTQP
ncbi:MAG TPA: DNA-binding domain-containing protein [Rhizomicrobium sp.]|jgi:hypothetical protein|nr:DNA-binding domain-containing protein [Rhizomicrobium sp.]